VRFLGEITCKLFLLFCAEFRGFRDGLVGPSILAAMSLHSSFRIAWFAGLLLILGSGASAQKSLAAKDGLPGLSWVMQDSGTAAGLRGIYSVDGKVAWASGTGGTVLRTIDGGGHWTKCAVPDAAADGATLDFRGVQAWDAMTAIVMASGPGQKSRLYKTVDGCGSWTLTLEAGDKGSFWDVVAFQHGNFGFAIGDAHTGMLIGDPVAGRFETHVMVLGHGWFDASAGCQTGAGLGAFAASNSSAFVFGNQRYALGAGGKAGAYVLLSPLLVGPSDSGPCKTVAVPIAGGTDSSGVFSVFFRDSNHGVIVGGDYQKPTEAKGTAAMTVDAGNHWIASSISPHGYRSSVQWSEAPKAWIAVGTNGSDISRDDGNTWIPLDDGSWNALSLPFVVGPKGRIARLSLTAAN
jgi:photosystem II stability/assembly factor-like uncharacterized protein